ncbi:serine hydrolase domain-containing protein [Undibacterium terreum]|uniref:Serine hydrolase n=1 Tax=Undibacterium terreum TaxID=1224302 RepID=A0A916U8X2_9BURK|nr:serine hydrolase domain-containing protein [Undibacterium terreum]GGC64936.1 serine hydrolase [Undibacterium terreum]
MRQQQSWWRILILAFAFAGVSQVSSAEEVNRMDQIVQSYVKDKQFSGTVLVARGEKILLNKGYGLANMEWNMANTPQTKFRLGSLTKQFTAVAIMMLAERGKLKLDDKVSAYLPDVPAAWRDITVFQLLTHTAGIHNFTDLPEFMSVAMLAKTPNEVLDLVRSLPLDFQPGEKHSYSNSGYVLLGILIEKVSGQSYESFLQQHIFTPLEMKDSGYDLTKEVIAHRAAGYSLKNGHFENADYMDMGIPFSAGALYSTTVDLLRWERGLYGGKLLTAESLKKLTTPYKDDYAFGLIVKQYNGSREIFHNGGINGFRTSMAYRPEDDLYIIVLGNTEANTPGIISSRLAVVAPR